MSEPDSAAELPRFVVVGHTNEGKSSVVSTLIADDSIEINDAPRTTKTCAEYKVRLGGEVLLILIDTPGFENAPRVERWLRDNRQDNEDPLAVIRRFVDQHKDEPRFQQECRLLQPILDGAGILYVIDGSHPYRPKYEKELEILRWTNRGQLGLINDKDSGQYIEEWRSRLKHWCSLVRYFNAHRSGFRNRVELLETLRELFEDWRDPISQVIDRFIEDRLERHKKASRLIAELLTHMLTHTQQVTLEKGQRPEDLKEKLEQQFHEKLRDYEQQSRRDIERLHDHHSLKVEEGDFDKAIFNQDLFAEGVWNILGLTPAQLIMTGAATGAAIGGTIDALVGGASFLAGTAIGAAIGAGSAAFMVYQRYETASIVKLTWSLFGSEESKVIRIGPHKNQAFPWIVLDRALLHYMSVCNRAHSNRAILKLEGKGKQGFVSELSKDRQKVLGEIFEAMRRSAAEVPEELVAKLSARILDILNGFDAIKVAPGL